MQVGDLVKMKNTPHTPAYPKGMGIVTQDPRESKHDSAVYVTWFSSGEERPANVMFLEAINEGHQCK